MALSALSFRAILRLALASVACLPSAVAFGPPPFAATTSTKRATTDTACTLFATTPRRSFLVDAVGGSFVVAVAAASPPPASAAPSKAELVSDLESSFDKMRAIPDLLEQNEWDRVRTILKTPPINKLWNLGESQNTLVQLAKETGEFEFLEMKDELAISLQMCDQLTYDNSFVYFQPGNGKVKIKEPQALANKASEQIRSMLNLAKTL